MKIEGMDVKCMNIKSLKLLQHWINFENIKSTTFGK